MSSPYLTLFQSGVIKGQKNPLQLNALSHLTFWFQKQYLGRGIQPTG